MLYYYRKIRRLAIERAWYHRSHAHVPAPTRGTLARELQREPSASEWSLYWTTYVANAEPA